MKKVLASLLVLAVAVTANAGVLFTENFDSLTPGAAVTGTSTWTTHSGTSGQITVDNTTGNNAAELTGTQSEDINATFAEITSGVMTATMDVYVTNALSGSYFFHFKPTSGYNYKGRVTIITDGQGGFNFGLAYQGSAPIVTSATGYNLNQWYSIQVDLDWANQSSSLTILNSGEKITDGSLSYYAVDPMNAVALRQASSGGDLLVDNIVVSSIPEPATMLLLGLGGLLVARKK